MMIIKRFEDIQAWQKARELTKLVYSLSNNAGFKRDFGLRDQIRTAATSVMANIAEGFDAATDAEFRRFLSYAKRSATEVQSHGYTALDQDYISQPEFKRLYAQAEDAKGLIGGFTRYLRGERRPRQSGG